MEEALAHLCWWLGKGLSLGGEQLLHDPDLD